MFSKNKKGLISTLLAGALIAVALPVLSVSAAEGNLTIAADKTTVEIGETVVVTLSTKDATVSSYAGGIHFDKAAFECVEIKDAKNKTNGYLYDVADDDYVKMTALSTVTEANGNGNVGFAYAGTADRDYAADIIVKATFEAKVAGAVDFEVYEDCDGADGIKYAAGEGAKVTVTVNGASAPTPTPTVVPTATPTVVPTEAPTVVPTEVPTEAPTEAPEVGENLALNGTIIVDSVNQEWGGDAANANDGNSTTRWQSNAKGDAGEDAWIGVKLAEAANIGTIVIDWEAAHPAKDGFKVQISADGETWTDVAFTSVRTGEDADDHQVDTITLTEAANTQYVRVLCQTAYVGGKGAMQYPSAYEFEVYEAGKVPGSKPTGVDFSIVLWSIVLMAGAFSAVIVLKKKA